MTENVAAGTLSVSVTLDTTTYNTEALWMSITNGPVPYSSDADYAAIYVANGLVKVTPYNNDPLSSHAIGPVIATTGYGVSTSGTEKTFSFTLNVNVINGWGGSNWKGTGFPLDAQGNVAGNGWTPYRMGAWLRAFADGAATLSGNSWTVNPSGNIGMWDEGEDFGYSCFPLVITPNTLPAGIQNQAYPATSLQAAWGLAPYSWSVTSGSLPPGLTLSSGGVISGTPTGSGSFTFTAEAQDSNSPSCDGSKTYTITVTNPCNSISISPSSLAAGQQGVSYVQATAFTAAGGTSPYSYTVTGLPPGLSYNSSTRKLTGTPTTPGTYAVVVDVTDANGCPGSKTYPLTVNCPAVSVSPSSLAPAMQGVSYNQAVAFAATGGTSPYTYSASGVPPGMSFNSSTRKLTGIPTAAGSYTVDVMAADLNGCVGNVSIAFLVNCPTLSLAPTSLPDGVQGVSYSQPTAFSASGGSSPYSYNASGLPPGMSFNSSTRKLTGVPTAAGNYTVSIGVTDTNGCSGSFNLSLNVNCPVLSLSPTSLPSGTQGVSYSQPTAFSASGGGGGYVFTATGLPPGMSLNAITKKLQGAPTSSGTFSVTMDVVDANGCTGSRSYTLLIACPNMTISPSSVPTATQGVAYSQGTAFSVSGGTTPHTWSATGMPSGMSFNSGTRKLVGTPTQSGTFTIYVDVVDANGCYETTTVDLTVACPTLSIAPSNLPAAIVGTAYTQGTAFSASGGSTPYSYSASGLPPGLGFNSSTRMLVGTATVAGSYTLTLSVTDANGCESSASYALDVNCPVFTLSPSSIPNGQQGVAYTQPTAFSVSGGTAPWSWSAVGLPPGLTFNAATQRLQGTPTSSGSFSVTVNVMDAYGCPGSRVYPVTIACPSMTVAPATLPAATQGVSYSQPVAFSASGGTTPYSWSASGLPAGMSLNGATLKLQGAPSGTGTFAVTVQATDAVGCSVSRVYSLTVNPPSCPSLTLAPSSIDPGTMGVAYTQSTAFSVSGGAAPYSWVAYNAPPGLALNTSTLKLTGTPTQPGVFSMTLEATDTNGCVGYRAYDVTIACAAISITPASLPSGTQGQAYSQGVAFSASGGSGSLSWAASGLPSGLSLNTSTLRLQGIPTASGSFPISISATDAWGCVGTKTYTLVIACPSISIDPASVPAGQQGVTYNQPVAFTASAGTAPFSWSASGLPTGMSMNSSTQKLSGTPMQSGSFSVTVNVTDANGCSGSRVYALSIACGTISVSPSSLADAQQGVSYIQGTAFSASGGSGTYTWTASGLPAGMSLDSGTKKLVGTPTTSGSFNVVITASDASGCVGSRSYPLLVQCPVMTLAPGSLPGGTQGVAYSQPTPFSISGGSTPYSGWSAAGLPTGLSLNTGTLKITGTPSVNGAFNVLISAQDANGCLVSASYPITINPVSCGALTLSPASLPSGDQGVPYVQPTAFSTSGGTAPYSYTAAGLPNGLTLNTGTQKLEGTPLQNGTFNVAIYAVDANGCSGSRSYSLIIDPAVCSPLTLSPSSLPNGTLNQPYLATLAGGGGLSPYSFSVVGGALPMGLTLDAMGDVTGTPMQSGMFALTLRVTDAVGCYSDHPRLLSILNPSCPPPTPLTGVLPTGFLGGNYGQRIQGTGGVAPYTYHLTSGSLPPGLTLDTSSGVLSGNPTALGVFNFQITSIDANHCVGVFNLNLTIQGLSLGDLVWNDLDNDGMRDAGESGLSNLTVELYTSVDDTPGNADDMPYAGGTTTTTDANGTYRFDDLPAGLYVVKVTPGGAIWKTSGQPDPEDNQQNQDNNGLQPGGVGTALFSPVVHLNPGAEPTDDGDSSPNTDLSIDFGLFSGIIVGDLVFEDSNNNGVYDVSLETGISSVTVQLLDGSTEAVLATTTTDGAGAYGFRVYDGGSYKLRALPSMGQPDMASTVVGIDDGTENNNDGTQSGGAGSPSTSFAFTLTPNAEPGTAGSGNVESTIDFGFLTCGAITVGPPTLANGQVAIAYSQSMTAVGGSAPYAFSFAGSLPDGLNLSPVTGEISGIPLTEQSSTFTIIATDAVGCVGMRSYTVVIGSAPPSLDFGDHFFSASSSASQAVSADIWMGAAATDAEASDPSTAGAEADDLAGTDDEDLTMPVVTPGIGTALSIPVTLNPAVLVNNTARLGVFVDWNGDGDVADAAESLTAVAVNASGSYSFLMTPPLSTAPGVKYLRVRLTEGSAAPAFSGTQTSRGEVEDYPITVQCPGIALAPASLPGATVGSAYNTTITASGGNAPYSYAVSVGALPVGLNVNAGTGVISGTPTVDGSVTFTLSATDSNGCVGSRVYTIGVGCPPINIDPPSLPDGKVGQAYNQGVAFSASGGTAPYSGWSVIGAPSGLSLDGATQTLEGTPTAAGIYALTVSAQDVNGCVGSRGYNLRVCPVMNISPAVLATPVWQRGYSENLTVSGGAAPVSWSLASGSLPTGLSLSAAGVLSGIPTAVAGTSFTVRATDANGCSEELTYTLTPVSDVDYGDYAGFPTAIAIAGSALQIGTTATDMEAALLGNSVSTADDTTGTDDENGITQGTLRANQNGVVNVNVTNTSGSDAFLNVWADWNRDDILTAGEQIGANILVANGTVATNTVLNLSPVPETVASGFLPIRARLSASADPGVGNAFAAAEIGEVEDHRLNITAPNRDYGDWGAAGASSDLTYSVRNVNVRLGATVDYEAVIHGNADASADDADGSDDEDGVTMPVSIAQAAWVTISVQVFNNRGANTYLHSWIDFDGDGSFNNALVTSGGERLEPARVIPDGTDGQVFITFQVPSGAALGGGRGARFRLTTLAGTGPTGGSGAGEIEDYVVAITGAELDYGDYSGWGSAAQVASADLFMGTAATDLENGAGANATATGDDTVGVDDEDLVIPVLTAGSSSIINVPVTLGSGVVEARVGMWVDWNDDGDVVDVGEFLVPQSLTATGVLSFTLTPPSGTAAGNKPLRVRVVEGPVALSPVGIDFNRGEVEDYIAVVNCPAIAVTPGQLLMSTAGTAYTQVVPFSASGLPGTFTWSQSGLPASITLDASTGSVTADSASAPGLYPFTVTAQSVSYPGCAGSWNGSWRVCPVLTFPASMPNAEVGQPYESLPGTVATAASGQAPYSYSLAAGAPAWLSIDAATGQLSGTPATASASVSFTVEATDAVGCVGAQSYTIGVGCPVITVLPAALPSGKMGDAYVQGTAFSASGGAVPYQNWAASGLPSGLALNGATLKLEGTPSAAGIFPVDVAVEDANGCAATRNYSLLICPVITVGPAALPTPVLGTSYNRLLSRAGTSASPYTWSITSGALPSWAALNTSTGRITGVPNSTASATFTVRVTDANGCFGERTYTVTPTCPTLTLSPDPQPMGYLGVAYSNQLSTTRSSGTFGAPYTYTLISGALPPGMSLSAAGQISGMASAVGSYNFTVRTTDSYGCTGTLATSLQIRGVHVGNLVWDDIDNDGVRDAGEAGIGSVAVELWNAGADAAIGGSGADADSLVSATTTAPDGSWLLADQPAGVFYLKAVPPASHPLLGGNPVAAADNGVDNDNNALTQPGGKSNPVYSAVFTLAPGGEPVTEDGDADTDLTLDLALTAGLSLGNRVWSDVNDNGLDDAGEPGVANVTLEVWSVGSDGVIGGIDDVLLDSVTSAADGSYLSEHNPPGLVYVRIPVPPTSHPLSSSITSMNDDGVDFDDNGHQLAAGSIYSPVVLLTPGGEPGTGGGTSLEGTIDFGLQPVAVRAFVSATYDDGVYIADQASGSYCGPFLHPFGVGHSQGNGDSGDVPHSIELGPDGNWYVAHFGSGNIRRVSPAGVDLGPILQAGALTAVDDFVFGPEGMIYANDPVGGKIVRFYGPLHAQSGQPVEPVWATVNGVKDLNFGPDGNLYLVVDQSGMREIQRWSTTTKSMINVIADDADLVQLVPGGGGIALVSGIDIHGSTLFGNNRSEAEVFKIDLTDPSIPGAPVLVADLDGASSGQVLTGDLEVDPTTGHLYIAGYDWGKPIQGGSFLSSSLIRVTQSGVVQFIELPIPTPPGPNNEVWPGVRQFMFGSATIPCLPHTALGSTVWQDVDADGIQDVGEPGIPGVRVELWKDADGLPGNGAELQLGWTFTDANGHFYFSGQESGAYQLKIPASNFVSGMPLGVNGSSSPVTDPSDNGQDGDDNGLQLGGPFTEVVSPMIQLSVGTEPMGDALAGAENHLGGDLDDFVTDADGDMTVDFGFVEPGTLGIGNLVYTDANGNQKADAGEGEDGVTVELYHAGAIPGSDPPLATRVTDASGGFFFGGLWAGDYFLHLPAAEFASGSLQGKVSLPGLGAGDDDAAVGDDGVDASEPNLTGISSRIVTLSSGNAPTQSSYETGYDASSDDASDSNVDLTVDFGLYRPVGGGDLVFMDLNENGHADVGEGVDGVVVEAYSFGQVPGVDSPLETRVTTGGGRYFFGNLIPGTYFFHIPATMFASGAPLHQKVSIQEGVEGDDDVGENGLNTADPTTTGVSSGLVALYPGIAPTDDTGETGLFGTLDNANDASVDLTIDFGFQSPVGIGNLVFTDQNGNGHADAGEGVEGVRVELYGGLQDPTNSLPLFTQFTDAQGHFFFNFLPTGTYKVHIPPQEFGTGQPLFGALPLPLESTPGDDDVGQNAQPETNPEINGVTTLTVALNADTEPVDSGIETGSANTLDAVDDDNHDLTIDLGFVAPAANQTGVGNLVYGDADGDGVYDPGEGIANVMVQVFHSGDDPLVDPPIAFGVNSQGNPITHVLTDSSGCYLIYGLGEGDYFVFLPPVNFQAGGPLSGWFSLPGSGGDTGSDDGLDENGVDAAVPSSSGIASDVIHLALGTEPTDFDSEFGKAPAMDAFADSNVDLTVDFGFHQTVAVGNLVFLDADGDGVADAGEGVANVTVELYDGYSIPGWDSPMATTSTNSDGVYEFSGLTPGSYQVHLPMANFAPNAVLEGKVNLTGNGVGDDDVNEDGVDQAQPEWFGVTSSIFYLAAGSAPTGAAEGGLFGTSDDANDASVDLTIDFGFSSPVGVGNLVFFDSNNNGIFEAGTETGVPNVLVQLHDANAPGVPVTETYTDADGLYSFSTSSGSYVIHIPASQFDLYAPLYQYVSSTGGGVVPPGTLGDDDVGEDGVDGGNPLVDGVTSASFTLAAGSMPTAADTETGTDASSDDGEDSNVDLTVDLGFAPRPLSVGNLVFLDLDADGVFDPSAGDSGVSGVLVRLFATGDDPVNDPPRAETLTGADGTYTLTTHSAGQYFLHVPASVFQTGAPLEGASSSLGFGNDDGSDDDAGEDGFDASDPATTGIYSITFDLAYDSEPVSSASGGSETGFAADSDDDDDANADLTIDLGFVLTPPAAAPLLGEVSNDVNGDGDPASNDPPLEGMMIELFVDADSDGMMDQADADPIATTTTASDGSYEFEAVEPGSYLVVQTLAAGAEATFDSDGGDCQCTCVTMTGQAVSGVDFLQCFTPTGWFYDTLTGAIIPGGHVAIEGPGEVTLLLDGQSGSYCFSANEDGEYVLTITPPEGYVLDPSRAPLSEAFVPSGDGEIVRVGSGLNAENGSVMEDASAVANPWYVRVMWVSGQPVVALNNIPLTPAAPATYALWLQRYDLGDDTLPDDDADHDGLSNLLEYALDLNPLSGLTQPALSLESDDATGSVTAVLRRPVAGRQDVRWQVEMLADLADSPAGWSALPLSPTVSVTADGSEMRRYEGIDSVFASDHGFIRLRVQLDRDGDGLAEATAVSRVQGWMRRRFGVGQSTLTMPLLRPSLYSGVVLSAASDSLILSHGGGDALRDALALGPCYIEVTSGSAVGHRWELDEAQCSGDTLKVDLNDVGGTTNGGMDGLAGASIAIRPHWTLASLLPASALSAGADSTAADGALFYNETTRAFVSYWLRVSDGKWIGPEGESLPVRLLTDEGLLLHLRQRAATLVWTGEVREHAFRLRLGSAVLRGGGYPLDQSPQRMALDSAHDMVAASQASLADRIKLWLGDAVEGASGYRGLFFYQAAGAEAMWVDEGDASFTDRSTDVLLPLGRACFMQSHQGSSHLVPLPWSP